nr:MAG: hypothetical protein [Microviridae sp.]
MAYRAGRGSRRGRSKGRGFPSFKGRKGRKHMKRNAKFSSRGGVRL